MAEAQIAVIGGTGLYEIEGLTDVEEVLATTPFGDPSDAIIIGTLEGRRVAFLPRHGRGHKISPTELPVRANIYALKSLGVEQIISISAVGSMRENIAPRDIVIPDQIFDRTKSRVSTFFTDGIVAHIGFAEPFCQEMRKVLHDVAREVATTSVHDGGNFLCMEGPQFSTKAESRVYRQWGMDIIGMTAIPEAKLAREAEICYATVAMVTDYDVWHETEEAVTVEMVLGNLKHNTETAKNIIKQAISRLPKTRDCECTNALQFALITQPDMIPVEQKQRLELLIGKYIK